MFIRIAIPAVRSHDGNSASRHVVFVVILNQIFFLVKMYRLKSFKLTIKPSAIPQSTLKREQSAALKSLNKVSRVSSLSARLLKFNDLRKHEFEHKK